MQPNVTTVSGAARQKGCSRQAIYDALERGDLRSVKMGAYRMILKDEKYDAYDVQETGGRKHRRYLEKQEG